MVALRVAVLALLLAAVSARQHAKVADLDRDEQETLVHRANTLTHDANALDDLLINMRKIEASTKKANELEHHTAPEAESDTHKFLSQADDIPAKADKDADEKFSKEMEELHKKEKEIEEKRAALKSGKDSGLNKKALSLETDQAKDQATDAQDAVKKEMVDEVHRLESQFSDKGRAAMDEKQLRSDAEALQRQIEAKRKAIYAAGKKQQIASEELSQRMYAKNQELVHRKRELTEEKVHLEKRRETLTARLAEYSARAAGQSLERDSQVHMSASEMEMIAQDILDLQEGNSKLMKEVESLESKLQKHYDVEKDRTHKAWVNRNELAKKQKEVERKEDQLKREIKQRAQDEKNQKIREQRQAAKEAQALTERIQNLNMLVGKGWQESKSDAEAQFNQKSQELADLDVQEQLLKAGKVAQALGLAKKK